MGRFVRFRVVGFGASAAMSSLVLVGCVADFKGELSPAHDAGVTDGVDPSAAAVDGGARVEEPSSPFPGVDAASADAPEASHPSAESEGGRLDACIPDGTVDEPDEGFTDTNCDGIDGEAARAIFVAPSGSDDSEGTLGAPVATLAHAVELATAQAKDVYVCNGEYAETLTILDAPVRLYGGFACDRQWKRVPDRALVMPARGPALTVENVLGSVVLERLTFRSPGATDAGESSVAAVIVGSASVTLSRVEIEAGDGASGLPGDPPVELPWLPALRGGNAPDTYAADACTTHTSCDTMISGGAGCSVIPAAAGSFGATTCPDGTPSRGGAGGHGANCTRGVDREPGRPGISGTPAELEGKDGAPGEAATAGFGHVRAGRYVADNTGTDGAWGHGGHTGRGGDGGRSDALGNGDVQRDFAIGGGGGQGGYPGCGGRGGKGGGGGGASIALFVQRTPMTMAWSRIITGDGGAGGLPSVGNAGQSGGPGGSGGGGPGVTPGQSGEPGGDGGKGGTGGPGAGGPSIGIVFDAGGADELRLSDMTFVLGTPGLGASGDNRAADGIGGETYATVAE